LEIACVRFLPRVTGSVEAPRPIELHYTYANHLGGTTPFDVEKQKVEIPKLRATLNALVVDGHLMHGTKLATELFAFADRMEEKLAVEIAKKDAAKKDDKEDDLNPVARTGTTARMYSLLRKAAMARPGRRQLVHLADVQRSVQRGLAAQMWDFSLPTFAIASASRNFMVPLPDSVFGQDVLGDDEC
jgi:hypothetical protein